MAVTVTQHSQGDQACTLDTEHTLGSAITTGIATQLRVDTNALAVGDRLVLRAYEQVQTTGQGGTERLALEVVVDALSAVPVEKVWKLPPILSQNSLTYKIEQTDGTGRTFLWEVVTW